MSNRFVAIDLSSMSVPDVIGELDFEDILQALKDDCVARMDDAGVTYDVATLESDPVVKVLEVAAYRETLLRARINSDLRAVLIAYAQSTDLENRAATLGVERKLITAATNDTPAVWETDASLRTRTQLALEAFSTAGPEGAYRFHVRTVDPSIKAVGINKTAPGEVIVSFLTDVGDGTPDADLIAKVLARLRDDSIRPLTDVVSVIAPPIEEFTVDVDLEIGQGPDATVVQTAAEAAIQAYLDARHDIGRTVYTTGIIAAAKVAGVENVILNAPTADIVPADTGAPYATSLTVTVDVLA